MKQNNPSPLNWCLPVLKASDCAVTAFPPVPQGDTPPEVLFYTLVVSNEFYHSLIVLLQNKRLPPCLYKIKACKQPDLWRIPYLLQPPFLCIPRSKSSPPTPSYFYASVFDWGRVCMSINVHIPPWSWLLLRRPEGAKSNSFSWFLPPLGNVVCNWWDPGTGCWGFLTGTGTSAPELKLGFGTPQPKALSLPGWGRAEERLSMKAEFLSHIMHLSNHKAGKQWTNLDPRTKAMHTCRGGVTVSQVVCFLCLSLALEMSLKFGSTSAVLWLTPSSFKGPMSPKVPPIHTSPESLHLESSLHLLRKAFLMGKKSMT